MNEQTNEWLNGRIDGQINTLSLSSEWYVVLTSSSKYCFNVLVPCSVSVVFWSGEDHAMVNQALCKYVVSKITMTRTLWFKFFGRVLAVFVPRSMVKLDQTLVL